MSQTNLKRTPVNVIAGALGVGKTTAINHLLNQRPKNERWAVLVNEYGLVGLDASIMEPAAKAGGRGGVEIREVAGGCICCSAAFLFKVSLGLLVQRRPDRLLIEPSGLATATGILDTLNQPGIREGVDLRSVVCLVDPAQLEETVGLEEVRNQIDVADVLLAGRTDLATADQIDRFYGWANALRPAKRVVGQVEMGRIEVEMLDCAVGQRDTLTGDERRSSNQGHVHRHQHDTVAEVAVPELRCDASRPIIKLSHHSSVASTVGWAIWDEVIFDSEQMSRWLNELAESASVRRLKGVLLTNEGWKSFNFSDGLREVREHPGREDSRLELISQSGQSFEEEALERSLRACLVSAAEC